MTHGTPDGARRRDDGAETTYYVLGERDLGAAVSDRLRGRGESVEAVGATDDRTAATVDAR
ncbi:hypothetical protein [Halobaculum lipolyticum]|uniref:Uncharacterized protein n=1 Tax=Halobaculum lipolyticum TaxID=3032001 RepID=A0ABD5WCK0_9EURY|nr:hypothetical protein [Halobaculum sp. DT31]